jgi:hypothetical protein
MLARGMMLDQKDQEDKETQEKNALMDAAMNDPVFKMQM